MNCDWIPIEERQPQMGERVVLANAYFVGEGYLTASNNYYRPGYLWPFERPTHWMPLPESPRGDSEDE